MIHPKTSLFNFHKFTEDINETKEDENTYAEIPPKSKPQKAHVSSEPGCQASQVGCQASQVGCQASQVGCQASQVGCQGPSEDDVYSVVNKTKSSGTPAKCETGNYETADDKTVCDDKTDQSDKAILKDSYTVVDKNKNSNDEVYATLNKEHKGLKKFH